MRLGYIYESHTNCKSALFDLPYFNSVFTIANYFPLFLKL